MKLKGIYSTLILLAVSVLMIQCKKKAPPQFLVAKTHEGRNTVAFELENGEIIGGSIEKADSISFYTSGRVSFYKSYLHYDTYSLTVDLDPDSINNTFVFADATFSEWDEQGVLDVDNPGYLDVDFADYDQRIVAGTFALNFVRIDSFYDVDSSLTVTVNPLESIRNGRFDIRY